MTRSIAAKSVSSFRRGLLVAGLLAVACSESRLGPVPAAGPAPDVDASLQFGDAPVEGFLRLLPQEDTVGWAFAVDLDEDGDVDEEGVLDAPVLLDYRFEEPGSHEIALRLVGSSGHETRSIPVVVNRRGAIRVVAETRIASSPRDVFFEGLTASPDGSRVFAGDFLGGAIYGIDAATLEVVSVVDTWYGVEGLAISPSGSFLFAAFKLGGAARLKLPNLEPDILWEDLPTRTYYAYGLDDRKVLIGGQDELYRVDLTERTWTPRFPGGSPLNDQFDVSPGGDRAAVIERVRGRSAIHLVGVPDLAVQVTHRWPAEVYPSRLAFHPDGERLYVIGKEGWGIESGDWSFQVLDARSGEIRSSLALDTGRCDLCVANPVARSRSGRFVAFESDGGVLIVDAGTDLPLARLDPGWLRWSTSVAASPVEDATFWTLRSDGLLRKIVVER